MRENEFALAVVRGYKLSCREVKAAAGLSTDHAVSRLRSRVQYIQPQAQPCAVNTAPSPTR